MEKIGWRGTSYMKTVGIELSTVSPCQRDLLGLKVFRDMNYFPISCFESLLNNNSWKNGKVGAAIKQVAPTELLEKFELY